MVPYFPQTKHIWCAPIWHTSYPQKREITHIFPKKSSFCPIFCNFLIFRGLGMCLLGARQLFAPGETLVWYSSFPRPRIFGVHPSGTPPTPCLPKKWPIFGLKYPKNVPYGCAPKFFFASKRNPIHCAHLPPVIICGNTKMKSHMCP